MVFQKAANSRVSGLGFRVSGVGAPLMGIILKKTYLFRVPYYGFFI